MTRRTALGVVGGLVVGAAGGYFLGMSSAPPAPSGVSTVTATLPASTVTVTAPAAALGPKYKFAWIAHGITDPFFVPSITGIKDADNMLGTSTQVLGPTVNDVPTQVSTLNTAIAAKFDGIACSFPDPSAFNDAVSKAVAAGIPVVGFNVDAMNGRLGYVGNSPLMQGTAAGNRVLASGIKSGDRVLVTDIVTVGSCSIRATTIKDMCEAKGAKVDLITISNYADLPGMSDLIRTDLEAHPDTKACHGSGSADTVAISNVAGELKLPGLIVGGFDLNPPTIKAIVAGICTWTLADISYLQGFTPVMLLWMHLQSHRTVTASMDTGLAFVDKTNVAGFSAETHYVG